MNECVMISRENRATYPWAGCARTPTTRASRGRDVPQSIRPSSSAVTYGASSASPISGCRRVCSCSPMHRFARSMSSARRLGSSVANASS